MWSTETEPLANGCVFKVYVEGRPAKCSDVFHWWRDDPKFRTFFSALLAEAPHSAFRWETPPITTASLGRTFEFALVESLELETQADPGAFAEHFDVADAGHVVSFPNLNGDAVLVVPCPITDANIYAHLAAFVRNAPDAQKHELWSLVGQVVEERVSATPIWLSTAGAGVPWLHVRIDQRPKYYRHAEYRKGW